MSDTNIIDMEQFRQLEMEAIQGVWESLWALRAQLDKNRPATLRRAVEMMMFGDLRGRAALVADIRRELSIIDDALNRPVEPVYRLGDGEPEHMGARSTVGDGGGLVGGAGSVGGAGVRFHPGPGRSLLR